MASTTSHTYTHTHTDTHGLPPMPQSDKLHPADPSSTEHQHQHQHTHAHANRHVDNNDYTSNQEELKRGDETGTGTGMGTQRELHHHSHNDPIAPSHDISSVEQVKPPAYPNPATSTPASTSSSSSIQHEKAAASKAPLVTPSSALPLIRRQFTSNDDVDDSTRIEAYSKHEFPPELSPCEAKRRVNDGVDEEEGTAIAVEEEDRKDDELSSLLHQSKAQNLFHRILHPTTPNAVIGNDTHKHSNSSEVAAASDSISSSTQQPHPIGADVETASNAPAHH
jgi:hypothetical protein